MIFEFLIILLIILVVLLLILFLKSIYVHAVLKINEFSLNACLEINYFFINIQIKIPKNYVLINFKIKSYVVPVKKLEFDKNNKSTEDEVQSNLSENETKSLSEDKFKLIISQIIKSHEDILNLIPPSLKMLKFSDNYTKICFGLKDNYWTMKLTGIIYAITSPFYAVGLNLLIIPIVNELQLNMESNIYVEIKTRYILVLLFNIVKSKNLRLLIQQIIDVII